MVAIRASGDGDLALLVDIVARAVRADRAAFEASPEELDQVPTEHWASLISASAVTYLASDGATAVGLVSGEHRQLDGADGERWAVLRNLWVEPTERGRGIGTVLVAAVESWAAAQAAVRIALTVNRTQIAAVTLYRRLGYAVDASDQLSLGMSTPLPAWRAG